MPKKKKITDVKQKIVTNFLSYSLLWLNVLNKFSLSIYNFIKEFISYLSSSYELYKSTHSYAELRLVMKIPPKIFSPSLPVTLSFSLPLALSPVCLAFSLTRQDL